MEDDPRAIGGTKGSIRKTLGKGSRLILLHAGSENGLINGADLVFQSKKVTGDYHDEMTSEHFEEWFHDSLLPNIPFSSIPSQGQVDFCFLGAAGHVIRIFQDMQVTSPEYLSG